MNSKKILFMIILLIGCLSQFASDIYSPSLPSIAVTLKASINLVQFSMAIYMMGAALSILFYGFLSEGMGRKFPVILGLVIFLVGSVLCFFAKTIDILILGRFIQGLGAGAGSGLWRAIFRDVYEGKELAKYASYLTIFVMIIIPAAPIFGGYLDHFLGWRSIFAALCMYSVVAIGIVIFGFKETSQHHHPKKLKLSYILKNLRLLLTNRIFIGITASVFLTYGATFAWFVVGPVLLIKIVGLSAVEFGWVSFIGGGIAFALGGWLNGLFVNRLGTHKMMSIGWTIMILAGIILFLGKMFGGVHFWNLAVPYVLLYLGATFIWPNAFSEAISPFGHIAGFAGPLYSLLQLAGGAVIGALASHLPDKNQTPLAMIFIFCPLFAWVFYKLIVRKKSVENHTSPF